jgi:hypothetical protein
MPEEAESKAGAALTSDATAAGDRTASESEVATADSGATPIRSAAETNIDSAAPENPADVARRRPLFWLSAGVLALLFIYCGGLSIAVYSDGVAERGSLMAHGQLAGDDYSRYLLFSATTRPFELLATMRFVTVFLGFVLVVLGCLFILAYSPTMYRLRLDAGTRGAALDTASPGLVLATLGAALVALALYRAADPKLDLPFSNTPPQASGKPSPSGGASAGPVATGGAAPDGGGPELKELYPGLGTPVVRPPATGQGQDPRGPR